jgi:hypothetical protein
MSDRRGVMLFDCSSDRVLDVEGLVNEMNKYRWADGTKWIGKTNADDTITIMLLADDGGWLSEHLYPNVGICDEIDEDEYRDLTLEEISKRFVPYIKQGWIEIAFVCHESLIFIQNGSLKIESNGYVTMQDQRRFPEYETINEIECYTPDPFDVPLSEAESQRALEETAMMEQMKRDRREWESSNGNL